MKSEGDIFLDLVRDGELPTAADEARVRRALHAALAAGTVASVAVPAALHAGWWSRSLVKFGSAGAKLGLLAVYATATLLTADTAQSPGADTAQAPGADTAQAPAGEATRISAAAARTEAPAEPGEPPAAAPREPEQGSVRWPPIAPASRPRPLLRQDSLRPNSLRANSLRAELDLLERVQAALKRGDGAAALRELEAHSTTDRILLAEREAARVLALCQLGRVVEAQKAAARFAVQHPDSVQQSVIAGSCANR